MNILVANNQLIKTGGTENYTYAIIVELLRLGHRVEYFTFQKGEISDRIESLGVKFKSKRIYDLIIANHNTTIETLHKNGCIIQTCHGITPILEQPSGRADSHVSVSYEVQQYLRKKNIESILINNGIDCTRFIDKSEIHNNLTSVLSLCQSEEANQFISDCCNEINVTFRKINKFIDNLWDIEDIINQSDLVIGIGRSVYDAMACGRTIISYDNRRYSRDFGDGYLNKENIELSLKFNCSGRGAQKTFTKEAFIRELRKYNKSDGAFMREFALQHLNIQSSVKHYLQIYSPMERIVIKVKKFLTLSFLYGKYILMSKLKYFKIKN